MNRRRLLTEYIRDDADEELDYFTIMPYTQGESYVSMIYAYGHYLRMYDGTTYYGDLWYSIDGGEWIFIDGSAYIDVPCFSKIRFKGNWHEVMKDVEYKDVYNNIEQFSPPKFQCWNASDWLLLDGTPLSLIHGDNFKEKKNDWNYYWDNFSQIFVGNKNIAQINNPKTFLPSTELSEGCYESMFASSFIQNAPELPAETLQEGCYYAMFANCDYLEEAPALNAKTLAPYCYVYMFYNCPKLRYAKVAAIDNFYENYSMNEMFSNNAEYGLVMLSQELIDYEFAENLLPKWAIISEDYPTNDEGYPEIKGDLTYNNIVCFNADFKERWLDNQAHYYFNRYESGPNDEGKQLFESFAEFMDIGSDIELGDSGIFFNRQAVTHVFYVGYEDTEFLGFYLASTFPYPDYVELMPDGSFTIQKISGLIYDYIKQ